MVLAGDPIRRPQILERLERLERLEQLEQPSAASSRLSRFFLLEIEFNPIPGKLGQLKELGDLLGYPIFLK